jgi:hypothetical protein
MSEPVKIERLVAARIFGVKAIRQPFNDLAADD